MTMDRHRFTEARALFEEAVERRASDRDAWLLEHCPDESLRDDVHAMLAADAEETSNLDDGAAAMLAAAERDDEESLAGTRIGDLTIGERIGRGATSTVHLARRDSGEVVAVKVLRTGLVTDEAIGRFRAERGFLSGLDHDGVITVHDAGILPTGQPFLVTEHVDGPPIDRYCRDQALSRHETLSLFRRVCAAVHHAHTHLVVHRDLKPTNILVTSDGRPKIVDFGVAKLLDEAAEGWTRTGDRAPMTPPYASPEQRAGQEVTTACDVYALGVVLHELLTGARPEAESADPERFLPVSEHGDRSLRGDLDAIVGRCLARPPGDRYLSTEHLAEDLRRHLEHEPVLARRGGWSTAARKLVRRRPILSVASAAVLTGLVAAWVGADRNLARVRDSESIAWRAHAESVLVARALGEVLDKVAAGKLRERDDVLEMLADAETRIVELGDAPEAETRLRAALAGAYQRLDRRADAERNARRALELARSTRGVGTGDVRRILSRLADLIESTRPDEAALLREEARRPEAP